MALPLVYAYRDDGPMSVLTKWKPRRVECTLTPEHSDVPGTMFVVKFGHGREGYACVISELVCTQLLARVGIRTLSSAIVRVSPGFAASCNFKSDFSYPVHEGDHYGTVLVDEVVDGPPEELADLKNPSELVLLWAADTWMGNIDRERNGNILLQHSGGGRFDLVAGDQSDCFGGTSNLVSDRFASRFINLGRASAPEVLMAAIGTCGGRTAVERALQKVDRAVGRISEVLSMVPPAWWVGAGLDPDSLRAALTARATKLESIIQPSEWELPNGVLL